MAARRSRALLSARRPFTFSLLAAALGQEGCGTGMGRLFYRVSGG